MKKIIATIASVLTIALSLSFTACGSKNSEKVIKIAASSTPHAVILNEAKDLLKAKGYELSITEFSDYVIPNTVVESGEFDANYFQHLPYLEKFNEDNNTHLVSVGAIHYEPFGLFGNNVNSLEALPAGTTIFVPSDDSNCTRALFLLAQENIITLPEGATIEEGVSILDVADANNKTGKGYIIKGVEAAQLPAQLKNNKGAIACINGNYAIPAGLSLNDALAREDADGAAATTYGNIIAVKQGNENLAKIKALIEVLQSEEIKAFIAEEFEGSVVAL